MTDLIEFLRARLDEDEAVARACPGNGRWAPSDIAVYGRDLSAEVRTHMARHDPARILADIEAKRRILFLAERVPALTRNFELFDNSLDAWAEVIKQLAALYADHPDFKAD